jgi:hypothetical protein
MKRKKAKMKNEKEKGWEGMILGMGWCLIDLLWIGDQQREKERMIGEEGDGCGDQKGEVGRKGDEKNGSLIQRCWSLSFQFSQRMLRRRCREWDLKENETSRIWAEKDENVGVIFRSFFFFIIFFLIIWSGGGKDAQSSWSDPFKARNWKEVWVDDVKWDERRKGVDW